jgi:protein tyrosine/serine phosphatase
MKIMNKVDSVIKLTVFSVCLFLTACATPTQPSAVFATISPEAAPIFNLQVVSSNGTDNTNAVYRSGQPQGDAEWGYLKKLGVKTVVKLNEYSSDVDEPEERSLAEKYNINLIRVYMAPEDFPHNWNLWAHPYENALMQAVEALENKKNLPALVHCSHGKDRTGLVVAVYSVRNKNYCKDAALDEMEHYGTSPFLFGLKPMLDNPNITPNPGCTHKWTAR